jgi:hypothetical protein
MIEKKNYKMNSRMCELFELLNQHEDTKSTLLKGYNSIFGNRINISVVNEVCEVIARVKSNLWMEIYKEFPELRGKNLSATASYEILIRD